MVATRNKLAWTLGTFFGSGYSPKAPGTAGSLAAVVVAWPLAQAGLDRWGFLLLGLLLIAPGIWASSVVARESGRKDPHFVVVDEVVGQWITLAGAPRITWFSLLLGFGLFRFFDILKPWPIRKFERFPGGTGIVLDDVAAGVAAALVLFAAGWYLY
jgi:phosphatidylglycerophosphatase A